MIGQSTTGSVAILAGALIGGGLFLLVAYVAGVDMPGGGGGGARLVRITSRRLVVAAAVGLAVLLLTRWVVLTAAAAVLVLVWPMLFGGSRQERVAAARIEGLATWA